MRLLLFLLTFALLRSGSCGGAFRFGAVLSTRGSTNSIADAKNGYELFFDDANANDDGRGIFVGGKPGTEGFYFRYEFLWREDYSDKRVHKAEVEKLLNEDKVHFLGGSHQKYALQEMQLANESNILCYHCCVAPDTIYERDFRTTFGIAASNREFTGLLIRRLNFEGVTSLAMIYEEDDEFTRTTHDVAFRVASDLVIGEKLELIVGVDGANLTEQVALEFALAAKEARVEAVIASVNPDKGKLLVGAFDTVQYSLKAFFLTVGPSKQEWVDAFEDADLVKGLLSAVQWHPGMNYSNTEFLSTAEYVAAYNARFAGRMPHQDAAAAGAIGLTLTLAIQRSFNDCDISATQGDADALLYDTSLVTCDSYPELTGYERVLKSLAGLNVDTFFGKVQFNYFRRNIGLEPVTTQVFVTRRQNETERRIEPVLPFGYATRLLKFPAVNRFREKCPAGTHLNPDPFGPCLPCLAGTASPRTNVGHCDSCPVGLWTGKEGQSFCSPCPDGTSTNSTGSRMITDCYCKAGYYTPSGERGLECEPCPDGAICSGDIDPPYPDSGHWYNVTLRGEIHPCDLGDVCLGGADSKCKEGYTGRLCSECSEGYFGFVGNCYDCISMPAFFMLFFGLLTGWYVLNVIVSQNVASLDMILSWAQLSNIIGDIDLNWTSMLTTMFGIAGILDFDVDILEPSCLLSWSFRHSFILQLCLPFIMTFMAACGYLLSAAVSVAKTRNWIRLERRQRKILSFFVQVPEHQKALQTKWDTTIATFLASVDTTYLTTAKYCFECFKCQDISGTSVLAAVPSVECGTIEHTYLIVLASLGIVLYIVGYLVCIAWKLYDLYDRRAFADEVNIARFGFVYQKYELAYYFTPAIVLVRKLLFVLVLVFVNNPAFKIGILAIVINCSLMIHVYTAPYIETYLDVLFNFLLLALMFEAFGGLMFDSRSLHPQNRDILEWIVMGTFFLLVAVFLVIFTIEMITKYHIHFMKRKYSRFVRQESGQEETGFFARLFQRKGVASLLRRALSVASNSSHGSLPNISYELLHTFSPSFVSKVMKRRPDLVQDWDRLTQMLKDYMSDQAETSYLSMEPTAKFWRKLVDRFPELIDFLAVADDEIRQHFNAFATHLYRNFYLTKHLTPLPLMGILNWRDHAPMAQWLAIASDDDRKFFLDFTSEMFETAGNAQAAELLKQKAAPGANDPGLMLRTQGKRVSKRQRRIMDSLATGTNPLTHSASQETVASVASKILTLRKFQSAARSMKARSTVCSQLPAETSGEGIELTADLEMQDNAGDGGIESTDSASASSGGRRFSQEVTVYSSGDQHVVLDAVETQDTRLK